MNTKMKVLSLAIVGLVGFAGSALAVCPAGPTTAEGGAWAAKTVLSGGAVAVVPTGLDASACKMSSALGSSFVSVATVTDNSPANEPRYRFQFLIDSTPVGTFANLDGVQSFNANADVSFPASGGRKQLVTVAVVSAGSGAKRLSIIASCNNAATGYKCATNTPALIAGTNRIEIDLKIGAGAAGALSYWLNAAPGATEPTATGSINNLDNIGWVGVKQANLGLSTPTPSFKSGHAAQAVYFDTFDSRRQTYIGH